MSRPINAAGGVIIRDAHLQIDLRAQGYGRERLELAPTPANIQYAKRLRAEILGRIERGTFTLAEYFPNSPRVAKDAPSLTWHDLAVEWLGTKKAAIQHSTYHHYEQTVGSYHFDSIRQTKLNELDFRSTKALLSKLPSNAKTFNNVATVLRQVFEYGFQAKLLRDPLHDLVEMRKYQKPGPDPFTLPEVNLLLSCMPSAAATNYFEFAFFSGMRPSELIALTWKKIDLRVGTALVDAALTRGQVKGTKNHTARIVELTSRARDAIERQRAGSQLKGGHVFLDAEGSPFTSTDGPLDAWWKPAIEASELRPRDARQTRHTFATMCLMGGITPGWVANQLGHTPEMFFRVYSRWIERADQGAERRKLDAFLQASQDASTGTKSGT